MIKTILQNIEWKAVNTVALDETVIVMGVIVLIEIIGLVLYIKYYEE